MTRTRSADHVRTPPPARRPQLRPSTRAPRPTTRAALLAVSALLLAGCTSPDATQGTPKPVPPAGATGTGTSTAGPSSGPTAGSPAGPTAGPTSAAATNPVQPVGDPTIIATNLDLPWSLVRIGGTTLVSERDTALVKEVSDDGSVRTVGKVAGVVPGGEGGLLGLATSGGTADGTTTWLYAYTTTAKDNRIVRMPLAGSAGSYSLGSPHAVFTGIPKAGNHNGGRIKFGPDGSLYATTGDAGDRSRSQNKDSLGGKILRLNPDGTIPSDNPFGDSPVFSYGHRNPQGITWDADGRMWAAEFGQDTWDEFNLIEAGHNYGWPIVEGVGTDIRFDNPVYQWRTSDASPSGLLYTRGTFFLAALRGERLWAIYTSPSDVTAVPWFTGEFGRLRDVIEAADGTLWVLTNNTGRAPRDDDDKILQIRLGDFREG